MATQETSVLAVIVVAEFSVIYVDTNYFMPIKASKTHITDILKRCQPTWSIPTTDLKTFLLLKSG